MKTQIQMLILMITLLFPASHSTAALNLDYLKNKEGGGMGGSQPENGKPHAPSIGGIFNPTDNSMSFKWSDKSKVEDGNRVIRIGPDNEEFVKEIGPGAGAYGPPQTYTDSGNLAPDRHYCYIVEAYNEHGASPSNKVCAYTDRSDPPGGVYFTKLRVLTHNIYGFTDTGLLDLDLETCGSRANALGDAIAIANPPYDIVGLQEYYDTRFDPEWVTCDAHHLRDAIEAKGKWNFLPFEGPQYSFTFQPSGEAYNFEADGGIGVYSRHPINGTRQSWEFSEKGPWLKTRGTLQGFLFAQIPIPGTGITVDTYVVHTYSLTSDHCDRACRLAELTQLADTIHDRSSQSGNPVLIMGDFNIKAPAPLNSPTPTNYEDYCYMIPVNWDKPWGEKKEVCLEDSRYEDITSALGNLRDLWVENHPNDPGITSDNCSHGLPTDCNDRESKRIDYIFVPTDDYLTNSPYKVHIRNRGDVKVVVWSDGFEHVSDHYGVEATIEIWETPTNWPYENTLPNSHDYNPASYDSSILGTHAPSSGKLNKTFGFSNSSKIPKPIEGQRRTMKEVQLKSGR